MHLSPGAAIGVPPIEEPLDRSAVALKHRAHLLTVDAAHPYRPDHRANDSRQNLAPIELAARTAKRGLQRAAQGHGEQRTFTLPSTENSGISVDVSPPQCHAAQSGA